MVSLFLPKHSGHHQVGLARRSVGGSGSEQTFYCLALTLRKRALVIVPAGDFNSPTVSREEKETAARENPVSRMTFLSLVFSVCKGLQAVQAGADPRMMS